MPSLGLEVTLPILVVLLFLILAICGIGYEFYRWDWDDDAVRATLHALLEETGSGPASTD